MDVQLINDLRRERTSAERSRLSADITKWIQRRRRLDQGLHETQIRALETLFSEALGDLAQQIERLDSKLESGVFYDKCREFDEAIVWLERIWRFYSDKFDQRESDSHGALLYAADEVVWSCYHPIFDVAGARNPDVRHGAAPLAFVDPQYSPAAVEADKPVPAELALNVNLDFLDDTLKSLPIPLLRLPPWCVKAPWWLVYIAHEVGHHVQHDLGLIKHFRLGMEAAAEAQQLPGEDPKKWGAWGEEIFADVFSILRIGPWAVRAIAEVERSAPASRVTRKRAYPAPVIRLALMAETASRLKMTIPEVDIQELEKESQSSPVTCRDFRVVKGAVDFALGPLPGGLQTLPDLCRIDSTGDYEWPEKIVDDWKEHLLGNSTMSNDKRPEQARMVAAASLAAWTSFAKLAQKDRSAKEVKLAAATCAVLKDSSPGGTRAEYGPSGDSPGVGTALITKLMAKIQRQAADS